MNYSVCSCNMPNDLHENQSRFCPKMSGLWGFVLRSVNWEKHSFVHSSPKHHEKLQKQNGPFNSSTPAWLGVSQPPSSQMRRRGDAMCPAEEQYPSRLNHKRPEPTVTGSKYKASMFTLVCTMQGTWPPSQKKNDAAF